MTPHDTSASALAEAASALLEPTFDRLRRVAETVAGMGRTQLAEADLGPVRSLLTELIDEDDLVGGMGFVAAPGIVDGQDRAMLWWQRGPNGLARLRLNFDPSSIDVYDYLQMEWFQLAQSGQERVTYGPYVDYSGSELYAVTATVPVRVGDSFLGVTGADLVVSELERRLIGVLRRSSDDVVVVSAERRVIAANTPRWVVGSRLPAMPAAGDEFADVTELALGNGWVLAVATEENATG